MNDTLKKKKAVCPSIWQMISASPILKIQVITVSSLVVIPIHSIFLILDPKGVLKQLHGSFMVIAWLMAASTGLLMPRYMKKTWVGKQFMKKDLWFVVRHPLHAVQIYYRKCVMVPVNRSTTED